MANNDDDGISSANEANYLPNCEFRLIFHRIEEEDVLNLLKQVDTNKASGVDQIGARVLRMAAEGIIHSLTSLFNTSLDTGQVPVEWKSANIIPIPKSGTSECLDNFHPISLLPIVAKVFDRLVHRSTIVRPPAKVQYPAPHLNQASDLGTPHRMSWWAW